MAAPARHSNVLLSAAQAGDWTRVLALTAATAAIAAGELAAVDDEGATLLHLALHQGRPEVAAVLLARGADPRAADRFGRTPLHYLAETADPAKARAAADFVAVLTGPQAGVVGAAGADPNAADGRGRTALHAAAVRGLPAVVAALLAAGARVNAAKLDGQTPLHLAVTRRQAEVARLLLHHGADPDSAAQDGSTPRALAKKFAFDDVLALFV